MRDLYEKLNLLLILKPYRSLLSYIVYLILLSLLFNKNAIVLADSTKLLDDSECIITTNDQYQTVKMSNGTEFTIKEKSSFDKVFNEINAPGYWQENEFVTDNSVITMTKHVPILNASDNIDGNETAEYADYNLRPEINEGTHSNFSSETEITNELQNRYKISSYTFYNVEALAAAELSQDWVIYIQTLSLEDQASQITRKLITDITERIENLSEEEYRTTFSLKSVVSKTLMMDLTSSLWISKIRSDLTDENNILKHLIVHISHLIKEEAYSITEKETLGHLRTQIYLRCTEEVNSKEPFSLISNDNCYSHFIEKMNEFSDNK